MNIDSNVTEIIKETILRHALGIKRGRTDIDIFEEFALNLELQFGAEISTYTGPSDRQSHWTLNLPKDGDFDATPSGFSVFFYIKNWADIVDAFKHIVGDYHYLEYDEDRSERFKRLCVKVADFEVDRDFLMVKREICAKLEQATEITFTAAGVVTNADPKSLTNWTWFHIRMN